MRGCVSGVHAIHTCRVSSELLTTGQAAELLGLSRQRVVDLCERGQLPFSKVGAHRRLRRSDIEPLVRRALDRNQERSLWLHRVVVGRLTMDPVATLAKARRNITTMRRAHHQSSAESWIEEWSRLLDRPLDTLLDILTARSVRALELRQNSPFAGVLSEEERQATRTTFREHWQDEHAA